jgi:hypothetical protein
MWIVDFKEIVRVRIRRHGKEKGVEKSESLLIFAGIERLDWKMLYPFYGRCKGIKGNGWSRL